MERKGSEEKRNRRGDGLKKGRGGIRAEEREREKQERKGEKGRGRVCPQFHLPDLPVTRLADLYSIAAIY